MKKSSFFVFIILINFLFAINSQASWNSPQVTCTEASGVIAFYSASGPQTFPTSKVLQTVDANLQTFTNQYYSEYSTVYLAYFIQNPSANEYNLIIQVTNTSGHVRSYTQTIASDQTFVMAQGGLVVMKQGTTNLNFYLLYQEAISQIISLSSTDRLFTSQIVSIVHEYGLNSFEFLYYDSTTQNLYPSRWDSTTFTSTTYRTDQATIPSIPTISTFIFCKYIMLQIIAESSEINLYDMVSGSIDLVNRGPSANALNGLQYLYYDNILSISRSDTIFVAMYDNTYANSHLFELAQSDSGAVLTYQLTSTPNVAGTLKPFTDSKTAFVQVDASNNVVAFYFANSIDFTQMSFYYQLDSSTNSDHITEIVSDFLAAQSVSFNFDGSYITYIAGIAFNPTLLVSLLKSSSIVRYSIQVTLASGAAASTATYTINKNYQVEIGSHVQTALTQNSQGTFQLSINIGCMCTSKSIIRFICFSGTQCMFTVQNSQIDCTSSG